MKIFGWAADNAGPGWYRLRVPFGELNRQGVHECAVSPAMPDEMLEEADVIVGQRVSQPGATDRWKRLASGEYGGRRRLLVFELDDDLWDVDYNNGPAHSFYNLSNPELLNNLTECARLADVCTVSTEPLADVVRQINPNVVVLPNQLPPTAFKHEPGFAKPGPYTIGWTGGASHKADVQEMVSGLRQHFRRNPRDTFINMGTLFPDVARAVGPALTARAWTDSMEEHYWRVAELDIGLAPLRPSLFNRSKSEIKFLEYAAVGAACIATRHGPYERTIVHEETGLLARTQHEWSGALTALTADPLLLRDLAMNAQSYAWTRRIEQHWQAWDKVYQGHW